MKYMIISLPELAKYNTWSPRELFKLMERDKKQKPKVSFKEVLEAEIKKL